MFRFEFTGGIFTTVDSAGQFEPGLQLKVKRGPVMALVSKSRIRLSATKKIAFASAILIGFFAALEIGCRVTGIGAQPEVADYIANWNTQWNDDFYLLQPSPGLGTNSDGLRDREHEIDNPRRLTRIVCLGDSVTFGYHLKPSESYSAFLELELLKQGRAVEVFNVALPGWSTRQQLIAYREVARKYRPDVVLVGFCLNDVAEMQNNLMRPPKSVALAQKYSNVFRALLQSEAREIAQVEELFESSEAPNIRKAWKLTLQEIKTLADEVKADGAHFVLAVFPFRLQIAEDAPHPIPQDKLSEFAQANDIKYFDLLPTLRETGESAFIDYDHLSVLGAQQAAKAIIDANAIPFEDEK